MPRKLCSIPLCGQPASYTTLRLCQNHYKRLKRYGNAEAELHQLGRRAELLFKSECIVAGREVINAEHYNSPYDLKVDGWAVDVKVSRPNNTYAKWGDTPCWQFRLHVHGKKSAQVDYYFLRLEDVPFSSVVKLLVPAVDVVKRWALYVTLESLLHDATVRSWADAYRSFLAGRFAPKQVAA